MAISDGILAAECALFATVMAAQDGSSRLPVWFALFFGAAAVSALSGGSVHGWFPAEGSLGHRILWPLALVSLGAASLALWVIAAHLQWGPDVAGWTLVAALVELCAYTVVVVRAQRFSLALLNYAAPAAAIGLVFLLRVGRGPTPPDVLALGALALAGVGAAVQRGRLTPHPRFLDHNTLYHLVQAASFALFFASAMALA